MHTSRLTRAMTLVASLALFATTAHAQTVVVTPSSPQGWTTALYGGGGATAAINTMFPRNGTGSAFIGLSDASAGEADHLIDFGSSFDLSSLSALTYDWYRSSASTTANWLNPAFALHMGTATSQDYLIFEYTYNHTGAAPTDQWVTEDILNGTFWRSVSPGQGGTCDTYGMFTTLAAFNAQCYGGNAQVIGFDFYMGYSLPGSFEAGVDNVTYALGTAQATTYNFEPDRVTSTPEPSSLAMLAPGLLLLVPALRRKRKA